MPYIESAKSQVGFLPFQESPTNGDTTTQVQQYDPTTNIMDDIDDQLQGDRYASTRTASEEALDATEQAQQGIGSGSESSELSPVDIATDSEAISVESHHSSSSELGDDMFASHLSTSTVRRKSDDQLDG